MNKKLIAVMAVTILTGCASSTGTDGSEQISRTKECQPITEAEVAALFERWNASLQTGNPESVVKNYAAGSVLLPTLSGKNRYTQEAKEEYFKHFLAGEPSGFVTERQIHIGCNMASDSGLYIFTLGRSGQKVPARYSYVYSFEDGEWLIVSHHSSLVPEE